MFTGTWCGFCPIPAQAIAQTQAEGKKVAVMKFHTGDSFETPATVNRENYYGNIFEPIESVPASVINGTQFLSGAASTVAAQKEYFEYLYNEYIDDPAVYTIELATEIISENPYKCKLTVNAVETFEYYDDEMRLMIALTETNIPYSWGGLSTVDNAVRAMYPDANGTVILILEQLIVVNLKLPQLQIMLSISAKLLPLFKEEVQVKFNKLIKLLCQNLQI